MGWCTRLLGLRTPLDKGRVHDGVRPDRLVRSLHVGQELQSQVHGAVANEGIEDATVGDGVGFQA